jgi:hypothetical protein
LYTNTFSSRPKQINPEDLTISINMDDVGKSGFRIGIGHIPLEEEAFRRSKPEFIMKAPVTEEELDGYQIWKQNS